MNEASNFPAYLEPAPRICRYGHTISPNGDYDPRECPTCERGTPAPRQDATSWRESMGSVARAR